MTKCGFDIDILSVYTYHSFFMYLSSYFMLVGILHHITCVHIPIQLSFHSLLSLLMTQHGYDPDYVELFMFPVQYCLYLAVILNVT